MDHLCGERAFQWLSETHLSCSTLRAKLQRKNWETKASGRTGSAQLRMIDQKAETSQLLDCEVMFKSCQHKGLGRGRILAQEAMRQELALCPTSTFGGLAGLKERLTPSPWRRPGANGLRRSRRPSCLVVGPLCVASAPGSCLSSHRTDSTRVSVWPVSASPDAEGSAHGSGPERRMLWPVLLVLCSSHLLIGSQSGGAVGVGCGGGYIEPLP